MDTQAPLEAEEELVAELNRLGVGYLPRQIADPPRFTGQPDELLRQLVRQLSSRVRLAVISLLLARPDYAEYVTSAVDGLNQSDAQRLCILYTAAVILQAKYADQLRAANRNFGRSLPDLFSDELGLNGASSDARLHELAHIHARFSGQNLNWAGTYENAALLLVRRWGSEKKWKA